MRSSVWQRLMELMADQFNTISAGAESESDIATKMDAAILSFLCCCENRGTRRRRR